LEEMSMFSDPLIGSRDKYIADIISSRND